MIKRAFVIFLAVLFCKNCSSILRFGAKHSPMTPLDSEWMAAWQNPRRGVFDLVVYKQNPFIPENLDFKPLR